MLSVLPVHGYPQTPEAAWGMLLGLAIGLIVMTFLAPGGGTDG